MNERGRRTLREQMLRNQQTENLYAALSGKPARELPIPPEPLKAYEQVSSVWEYARRCAA